MGGEILLESGQWMGGQPSFPLQAAVQQRDYLRRSWGKNSGRGNRRRTFRWSQVVEYSTTEEAMSFAILRPTTLPMGETGELLLQVTDGASVLIKDFVLRACNARHLVRHPTWIQYDFEALGGEHETVELNGIFGVPWGAKEGDWFTAQTWNNWKD